MPVTGLRLTWTLKMFRKMLMRVSSFSSMLSSLGGSALVMRETVPSAGLITRLSF